MMDRAPGKTKLQVTGICYIVEGVLCILSALWILVVGGAITAMLTDAFDTGTELGVAIFGGLGLLLIVGGAFFIIMGILGIINCNKPEKCGVNFVFGIVTLVLAVMSLSGAVSSSSMAGLLPGLVTGSISMALAVLYTLGAHQNKKFARQGMQYQQAAQPQQGMPYQPPIAQPLDTPYQQAIPPQQGVPYQPPVAQPLQDVQYQQPIQPQQGVQYRQPVQPQQNVQYRQPIPPQQGAQYQPPVPPQQGAQYQQPIQPQQPAAQDSGDAQQNGETRP